MAIYTSVRSGRWDDDNLVTGPWGIAAHPIAGDTANIANTHTVDVNAISGDEACAITNINAGGKLHIEGGAKLTTTGAGAFNGELEMRGSGNAADPTELVVGGAWTQAATAIWDVVGTLGYANPDIKITGNATGTFNFQTSKLISGTLTQTEFNTFGINVGPLNGLNMYLGGPLSISDIKFQSLGNVAFNSGTAYLTGTIYSNGHNAASFATTMTFLGTATMLFENSIGNCGITTGFFYDDIIVNANESIGASRFNGCYFLGRSRLVVLDVNSNTALGSASSLLWMIEDSTANLTTLTNARLFFTIAVLQTTGLINLSCQNGMSFIANRNVVIGSLRITVTTGTVVLTTTLSSQCYWQASRSVDFGIIGSTAITLNGTGLPQFEPVLYKYNYTTYLFGIQYDLTYGCPNYTALYGASTGWTAATNTLAAGGVLRIYTTGHTATGMDMAISSFGGFALATSGTAAYTAEYFISFDGGVLWSAALTLAQLQSNTYIINGNTYNTDPRYNIQLRIALTSAGGGTVTQVRVTGITYNPAVTSSWNVRWNFEQDEGVGYDTNNDSFHQISTHKIGVPIALSGGGTTLAANLVNMADNAGGAAFNSATDSLHELRVAINAIAAAIAALLAPILRIVQYIKVNLDRYVFHRKKE